MIRNAPSAETAGEVDLKALVKVLGVEVDPGKDPGGFVKAVLARLDEVRGTLTGNPPPKPKERKPMPKVEMGKPIDGTQESLDQAVDNWIASQTSNSLFGGYEDDDGLPMPELYPQGYFDALASSREAQQAARAGRNPTRNSQDDDEGLPLPTTF
jgi:hypothetical protein